MSIRPSIRNAALVGAIAAVTASAWAINESKETLSESSLAPTYSYTAIEERPVAMSSEVAVSESLSPNESIVLSSESAPVATESRSILVAERSIERTAITVEEQRLTEDQRIQSQVMDLLARNPRLSGKIGVESYDAIVTLSGWTPTAAQARHAATDARSVMGVRDVRNEIRARVGGSV